jgi:hypothetical protein
MNNNVNTDLEFLTQGIRDIHEKPYMRPTLTGSLVSLGHDEATISTALDELFASRTLQ